MHLQGLSQHGPEPNPALVRQAEQRAQSIENRTADRITAFAGSMPFVYIHIAWSGCWIGFGRQNEELLELSRQILDLTKAIRADSTENDSRVAVGSCART